VYFLLNEASVERIRARILIPDRLSFVYDCGKYRLQNKRIPENGVAYDEFAARELYEKYGLNIAESLHYDAWAGRASGLNIQHNKAVILATKGKTGRTDCCPPALVRKTDSSSCLEQEADSRGCCRVSLLIP
jgi:hypothetical protein